MSTGADPSVTTPASRGIMPPPSTEPTDDNVSDTPTIPDVSDVGMDDSAPPATDVLTTSSGPSSTRVQVATDPRSGITYLVQTSPMLLFRDGDVRPQWLTTAIKDFLQYMPYFGNFGKAIDLFLAQEARLRYPQSVGISSSVIPTLTIFVLVTPACTPIRK